LKLLNEEKLDEVEFRLSDLIKNDADGRGMILASESEDDEYDEETKIDFSVMQQADNPIN